MDEIRDRIVDRNGLMEIGSPAMRIHATSRVESKSWLSCVARAAPAHSFIKIMRHFRAPASSSVVRIAARSGQ
jgi:hypothetical protein